MFRSEQVITDRELRQNHDFVMAFEALRKRHGHREMGDGALHDVAAATGIPFERLRVARHLRNALAHGERVNREALERLTAELISTIGDRPARLTSELPTDGQAFRIHAWLDERLEQEMLANGFVSVGGDEIGDLTGIDDPERIAAELTRTMPDRRPNAIRIFVGYWRRFLWEAQAGDLCVLPTRSEEVAIGEFVGPYHYAADAEPRARHRRNVDWLNLGIPKAAFGSDLTVTIQGRHTVQEFKARSAVARLRVIAATGSDPGP